MSMLLRVCATVGLATLSSLPAVAADDNDDLSNTASASPSAKPSKLPLPVRFIKNIAGGAPAIPSFPDAHRRGMPPSLDPVFPGTEFIGTAGQLPIGVPDGGAAYPVERFLWKHCPLLQKARIRVYGWNNPGIAAYSSSRRSNYPLSYNQVPRQPVMDQQIVRIERYPDTVQREHCDWGFRFSSLWGHDYRFTTAKGWVSDQLLSDNRLYGWDPVELYGVFYSPKPFKGLTLKVGRYISPPDIEAQLAPDNYLYSHSLMFTFDTYTNTGALATIQLTDRFSVSGGIHAGNDMAPWTKGALPTGQWMARYVSKNNKDSLYGGMCNINNGRYRLRGQHTNLQQSNLTWTHVFNDRIHTMTEVYYIWQNDALAGGTVNNGPARFFFKNVGAGRLLPGISANVGVVNYTNIKLTNKDYLTLRPVDFLTDGRGALTGFQTAYGSWTIGWCHRFTDTLSVRPEIRYESALRHNIKPYDNGTRSGQLTLACDLIQRW